MPTPAFARVRAMARSQFMVLLATTATSGMLSSKTFARYLAKVLEESIPDVAVVASKTMNWLRAIARTLAKAGVGMAWTSPAGVYVIHEGGGPKGVPPSPAANAH